MNKKLILASSLVFAVSIAVPVFAQTSTSSPSTSKAAQAEQPVLQIGPTGKVLMRGTIASVGNGTMTVNGWGGVWTVNVPSSANILPSAAANDLTQFKAGDFVGVEGMVDSSANWTINATIVRDWTYRAAVSAQVKTNVQAAQTIRRGESRDFVGTASNVSASSLTLTAANGTAYTVTTGSNAEVVNRKWETMPLTSIQSGDNVRVYGVNASDTVTAQIVRDVTLPLGAASTTGR